MVDEYATESQVRQLEQLVLTSEEARRTYVTCMRMHGDLCYLLGGKSFEPKLPQREPVRRRSALPVLSTAGEPRVAAVAMC